MKQIILLLLTTLFAVSGSAGAPLPDTTATPLSYQTTTQLDPKTHIQRTTLDPQGYELEVYFEVPIFEESTQGGKSINAFFYELNEAFFTPDNENLKRIWEYHTARGQRHPLLLPLERPCEYPDGTARQREYRL